MSTSVYTGLNPFNFIRKHFLQICVRKVAVHLWKMSGSDVHEQYISTYSYPHTNSSTAPPIPTLTTSMLAVNTTPPAAFAPGGCPCLYNLFSDVCELTGVDEG
jgi:hypothetical protein